MTTLFRHKKQLRQLEFHFTPNLSILPRSSRRKKKLTPLKETSLCSHASSRPEAKVEQLYLLAFQTKTVASNGPGEQTGKKTTCKNTNNQERERARSLSLLLVVGPAILVNYITAADFPALLPSSAKLFLPLSHPGFGIPAYGLCVSNPHVLNGWRPRKQYI